MCEKDGGLGGVFGSQLGNHLPSGSAQLSHMFRDDVGHLPDTPRNRQLIMELVNDESCRLGTDKWGKTWYAKTNPDGTQLWASVLDGKVQNCGQNDSPRSWDDETGLSKNTGKTRQNAFKRRK